MVFSYVTQKTALYAVKNPFTEMVKAGYVNVTVASIVSMCGCNQNKKSLHG